MHTFGWDLWHWIVAIWSIFYLICLFIALAHITEKPVRFPYQWQKVVFACGLPFWQRQHKMKPFYRYEERKQIRGSYMVEDCTERDITQSFVRRIKLWQQPSSRYVDEFSRKWALPMHLSDMCTMLKKGLCPEVACSKFLSRKEKYVFHKWQEL